VRLEDGVFLEMAMFVDELFAILVSGDDVGVALQLGCWKTVAEGAKRKKSRYCHNMCITFQNSGTLYSTKTKVHLIQKRPDQIKSLQ